MNKILIIKAIEKAKAKKKKEGKVKPSLTDSSEELSNYIDENEGFQLNERTYRDYYNEAKKLLTENGDINISQLVVINGLCKYLGFDNYQEFIKSIEDDYDKTILEKVKIFIKKHKILISIFVLMILGFIAYNYITRQRWMIWKQNHYVEVKLDIEKYDVNQLKFYKEDRIKYFKKIIPKCEYEFFNEDGSVKVWYGKNNNKELEYFTALGLHPETGNTLRPITQYMIDKYICAINN